MLDSSVREVLQKPLIARLATIDKQGYPHVVPLWFDLDGEDIVITSDRKTRKIDYMLLNPKGTVQVGGDESSGVGYLFKGELSVEVDPGFKWVKQITRRYENPEQAEKDVALWTTTLDMCVIRLKVKKVIKVL